MMPEISAPRRAARQALRDPAISGALGLGAAALLRLRDPHVSGSYGFCPFLVITGQPCPGCGGMRAVNDLTRGDFVGAISSNAFAVALVVFLGISWIIWVIRRARGSDVGLINLPARTAWVVLPMVGVFSVFRMTPWGAWLAP